MNTQITYVCEKECCYGFDFSLLHDFELDISNYPVDFTSLYCTDILIFQYTQDYEECLNEIARIHSTFQYKPIILVSDRFDSRCLSWAITQQINNIILLPDELVAFKKLIDHLSGTPPHAPSQGNEYKYENDFSYSKNNPGNIINYKTRNAINFIHRNYSEKIQIKEVASLCNMSISTFTRIFKSEQGVTFCQYINFLRMCNAKKFLRNTNLPISKIAHLCGFNDAAYFTRLFKLNENTTPKAYRQLLK